MLCAFVCIGFYSNYCALFVLQAAGMPPRGMGMPLQGYSMQQSPQGPQSLGGYAPPMMGPGGPMSRVGTVRALRYCVVSVQILYW